MHIAPNHKRGLISVSCSVLLVSSAQLLLKIAMMRMHGLTGLLAQLEHADILGLVFLGGGLFCYSLSFLIWQRALSNLPLSIAYPLLSLSYPLVYIATLLLPSFTDTLNPQRVAGVLLILIGTVLLAPQHHAKPTEAF